MKAMLIRRFGEPEVFEPGELPTPQPRSGQVLIRVHASSVNPVDCKIRRNGPPTAPALPAVLHGDVAGVIEAVGPDVASFRAGDAVFGCAGGVRGHGGALAQFMLADARLLAKKPRNLDFAQAAALPLVTLTAWEGLFDKAQLQAGESLLVYGGTGGVGHIALQLGRNKGAKVFATASAPDKARQARALGADEVILHTQETLPEYLQRCTGGIGFDVVFDGFGGAALENALRAARVGGRVVSIQTRGSFDLTPLLERNLSLHAEYMMVPLLHGRGLERHGEILRAAAALAEAGHLRPLLDPQRFTFSRVADAHRHWESGRAMGKIVLENDLT